MGKILRVNLSTGKISVQNIEDEFYRIYVGNTGLAAKILYDEVPTWAGAFDSRNRLIFSTGPVTGTMTQTAGRHSVITKSPLTGCFGDASCGGFWGAELKFAGYDAIVFNGRAEKPVHLWVNDDSVELKDASSYWGMDVREVDRALVSDLGDRGIQVSAIGKAGENKVLYAGIGHDDANRIAARCGVGAVMGFMNLKAVSVRGHQKVPIANRDELSKAMRDLTLSYRSDPTVQRFHQGGTAGSFASVMALGDTPTYNYASEEFGVYDEARISKMSWPGGFEKVLEKTSTCYACAIACRRVSTTGEGKYTVEEGVEGVEYETLTMLGSNCGVDDVLAINFANDLCNKYGLDTISTGGTISFAMECFERGIISSVDTEGIDLRFGNGDAMIEIIHKIARREGFGNILAEGSRRAAEIIGNGATNYAMQVKGLELPAHDPRAFQSGGAHYACCPVGADHMEGMGLQLEAFGVRMPEVGLPGPYERFSTDGKGELAKGVEDWWNFLNVMGWCIFTNKSSIYRGMYLQAFNAVTGLSLTLDDALHVGERVYNLKKAFNIKHGVPRKEDTLPERLLTLPNKRADGNVSKLEETLPNYYLARGWDWKTGRPTKEKLTELSLDWMISELWT